jgi:hypothetical protein
MVPAAEVQPLEGAELIDLETARRERDAYTSAQRQARAARIERNWSANLSTKRATISRSAAPPLRRSAASPAHPPPHSFIRSNS